MDRIIALTILQAYHSLEDIVRQIDQLVYARAISTQSLKADCVFCTVEKQVDKIVKLMAKKNSLIDLKILVNDIISGLENKTSQRVLEIKYVKSSRRDGFLDELGVSSRTYFRYIKKAEMSFAKECEVRGLDEEWFEKNFFDQNWMRNLYQSVKESKAI